MQEMSSFMFAGDAQRPGPTDFLMTADMIGNQLCRDALWDGDRCNWLGWSMQPFDGEYLPCVRASGPSMYDGLAGVGLYLSELSVQTQDGEQQRVRDAVVRQILHLVDQGKTDGNGFYSGLLGVAYCLARIAELSDDEGLLARSMELVKTAANSIPEGVPDVLSGSAGVIAPLIDLAQRFDQPELIPLATKHALYIIDSAISDGHTAHWPINGALPATDGRPIPGLLGYSHGTAGIALALAELYRVDPDEHLIEMSNLALEYERQRFDSTRLNWPDLRPKPADLDTPDAMFPVAWCHGSTGIGLARLRMLKLRPDDAALAAEVDAALQSSSQYLVSNLSSGSDFSYCHGLSGPAEFLLQVSEQFDRQDIKEGVERIASQGIQDYAGHAAEWPCGIPNAGQAPGLMLGLAGIGYFYLRLALGCSVPGVLTVHPEL